MSFLGYADCFASLSFHFKSAKTRGNANTNDIAKLDCSSSGISTLDWDVSEVNTSATSGYLLTSAGLRMADLTIYYGGEGTNYMTTCCNPLAAINGSVVVNHSFCHETVETVDTVETVETLFPFVMCLQISIRQRSYWPTDNSL